MVSLNTLSFKEGEWIDIERMNFIADELRRTKSNYDSLAKKINNIDIELNGINNTLVSLNSKIQSCLNQLANKLTIPTNSTVVDIDGVGRKRVPSGGKWLVHMSYRTVPGREYIGSFTDILNGGSEIFYPETQPDDNDIYHEGFCIKLV